MDNDLARLQVRIDANDARFQQGVRRTEQAFGRSARSIESRAARLNSRMENGARRAELAYSRVSRALVPLGAALGVAFSVRGFDQALSRLDAIGNTADRLGLTTDALQELRSAASQAGISTGTLDMAMQRFGRRVAEARQGTGAAKSALQEMGIALTDAEGKARPLMDVLRDVADRLATMEDKTDRNRLAFKLFDSEGVQLVNMLDNGSAGLDKFIERAHEMNAVIEEDSIRAAQGLKNEIDLLSDSLGNRFVNAAGRAAQWLNKLFDVAGSGQIHELESEIAALEQWISQPRDQRILNGEIASERDIARAWSQLYKMKSELDGLLNNKEAIMTPPIIVTPDDDDPLPSRRSGGSSIARAPTDHMAGLDRYLETLRHESELIGKTAAETARLTAEYDANRVAKAALEKIRAEGREASPEELAQLDQFVEKYTDLAVANHAAEEAIRAKTKADEEQKRAQEELAQALSSTADRLIGVIQGADSAAEAIRNLALEILNLGMQGLAGQGPFGNLLGDVLGNLFGGGGAFTSSMPSMPSGGIPIAFNAKGGVYSGPGISAYSGSVVSQPTVFPFAKGIGLMGEAGPEAILPLRRGPGGKLGVEASGGGGGTVVNVYAPPGSEAREERSSSGAGGMEQIDIYIDQKMAQAINRPGSYTQRALATGYAARPITTQR
ncbi:MAG TPA: phage tail tape measure protein [Paracoccaceae bacterium]|nr:phage tail tape measure protein [Paracoccaceae bacterium]